MFWHGQRDIVRMWRHKSSGPGLMTKRLKRLCYNALTWFHGFASSGKWDQNTNLFKPETRRKLTHSSQTHTYTVRCLKVLVTYFIQISFQTHLIAACTFEIILGSFSFVSMHKYPCILSWIERVKKKRLFYWNGESVNYSLQQRAEATDPK